MIRAKLVRHSVWFAVLTILAQARGDEGMWTFDHLPTRQLRERYGFEPSVEWVARTRAAAVRFSSGGSGAFVSPEGLIMTNHHIAADTLQKLSSPAKDYYRDGFLAASREQEAKAPDLELNVLMEILDVTDRVQAAAGTNPDDAAAGKARRAAIAEIEKESLERTGLRSDVVTLYGGARFHLYRYKKYTDVRLVFAPEFAIASFGGDADNFEFPRYDLDVAFFRAYEDGRPAQPIHHLPWSESGVKEGDLVFVVGNPGSTSRLNTVAHLEYLRDVTLPLSLALLTEREAFLQEYGRRGSEARRQASQDLQRIQNSKKVRTGELAGLRGASLIERKRIQEQALRDRIAADPVKRASLGSAWEKIARTMETARGIAHRFQFLEATGAFYSRLYEIARTIVRLVEEDEKPNAERLREYGQARRASLELSLYSPAPIYPEYEEAKLARSLSFWRQTMGESDPIVRTVLAGRTPEDAAASLVRGCKLADITVRRSLVQGGKPTVAASDDPMIRLARALDAESRAVRKVDDTEVEDVQTAQYALIARALFEDQGTSTYPDATFTLRLAFGVVKGYEADGRAIAPFTTIGGAFAHADEHGGVAPYELPSSWVQARQAGHLSLETPLNFVTTSDTIGGNSGSPIIARSGAVVGLNFDRNRYGLSRDFGYDDRQGRNIAVDVRAITVALRSVYHADSLVRELRGR
jgi:hypothetical protein